MLGTVIEWPIRLAIIEPKEAPTIYMKGMTQ